MPTDDDLIRTVRQGLTAPRCQGGTASSADGDIADVVAYIKSLSPQFATPPRPVTVGAGVPSSPESIARGQQVYDKLQCGKCHGSDGRGTGAVATTFEDDWKQPLRAADLTEPWTFHGGATSRDVYLRFRTGMAGTPMPSFADAASDGEMWDLANYVVSLARKPVWSMNADEIEAFYARQEAEAKANPVKRGALSRQDPRLRRVPLAGGRAEAHVARHAAGRRHAAAHRAVRRLPDGQSHIRQGDRSRQLERR